VDPSTAAFILPSPGTDEADEYLRTLAFQRVVLGLVVIDVLCPIFLVVHLVYGRELGASPSDSGGAQFARALADGARRCIVILNVGTWLASFAEHAVYAANSVQQRSVSYLRLADAAVVLLCGVLFVSGASPMLRMLSLLRLLRFFVTINSLEAELRARTLASRSRAMEQAQVVANARAQLEQTAMRWTTEAEAGAKTSALLRSLKEENDTLREALLVAAQEMAEFGAAEGIEVGAWTGAETMDSARPSEGRRAGSNVFVDAEPSGGADELWKEGASPAAQGRAAGSVISDTASASDAGRSSNAGSGKRLSAGGVSRRRRVVLAADGEVRVAR
jgi:hypothetical protein